MPYVHKTSHYVRKFSSALHCRGLTEPCPLEEEKAFRELQEVRHFSFARDLYIWLFLQTWRHVGVQGTDLPYRAAAAAGSDRQLSPAQLLGAGATCSPSPLPVLTTTRAEKIHWGPEN